MTVTQQIKTVFSQALRSFGHNKVALFKALLPVVILYSVVNVVIGESIKVSGFLYFFLLLISCFMLAHMMIVIHKMTLIGADSVPEWGVWLWGKKEFMFCIHIVIFFIAIGIILGVLGLLLIFLPFVSYLVVAYLIARFYLIFPSTAIGDKMPLEESWKTTQGHGFMMFVVVSVLPFMTSMVESFFKTALLNGGQGSLNGGQGSSILAEIILPLLFAPVLVFQVVLLSEAYRYCLQFRPQKLEDIPAETLSNLTRRKDIFPKD